MLGGSGREGERWFVANANWSRLLALQERVFNYSRVESLGRMLLVSSTFFAVVALVVVLRKA